MPRRPSAVIALATGLLLAGRSAAAQSSGADTVGAFHRAPDGVRVHYTVAGSGPLVVLVHGFLSDGGSWRASQVPDRLRAAGYRVAIVDLRGNGPSDHPAALAAYEGDAEARDVMGVASDLGVAGYCAVGYSRGAIIAARLLVLDPRVRCGVLGGMGADFTNPAWPRREAAYRVLAGLPLDSAAAAPVLGMVRAAEQRGLDRNVLALQQRAQPSTSRMALGDVRQPVMVIAGDRDHDNGEPRELVALLPNAVHAVVPGDHGGTLRSAPFADSVAVFVGRTFPTRPIP